MWVELGIPGGWVEGEPVGLPSEQRGGERAISHLGNHDSKLVVVLVVGADVSDGVAIRHSLVLQGPGGARRTQRGTTLSTPSGILVFGLSESKRAIRITESMVSSIYRIIATVASTSAISLDFQQSPE